MKSVFVLEHYVQYEGGGIVAVFESRPQAERFKAKIERKNKQYKDEMERTDYESSMAMPDYLNEELPITEYKVVKETTREKNHKQNHPKI